MLGLQSLDRVAAIGRALPCDTKLVHVSGYADREHAMKTYRLLALLFATLYSAGSLAAAPPVLVISVDGLHPAYVTDADRHGLMIPTLRRLMQQGAYARGVVGVVPTVTYPSHTTLMTRLTPREHGIISNT